MTRKDRIHAEWCLCPACRPLRPEERAGPLAMGLVWGTGFLLGTATLALAAAALRGLL